MSDLLIDQLAKLDEDEYLSIPSDIGLLSLADALSKDQQYHVRVRVGDFCHHNPKKHVSLLNRTFYIRLPMYLDGEVLPTSIAGHNPNNTFVTNNPQIAYAIAKAIQQHFSNEALDVLDIDYAEIK